MENAITQANYLFKKDNARKIIIIDINGFFGSNDINAYLKDYENLKRSVDVKNTTLVLNGKDLKAFPREVEGNLAELYKDYSTFKKVYIATPTNIVTKMQVQRVLKATNLIASFEFVDKIEDIK